MKKQIKKKEKEKMKEKMNEREKKTKNTITKIKSMKEMYRGWQ
jgi:hypothetical protein